MFSMPEKEYSVPWTKEITAEYLDESEDKVRVAPPSEYTPVSALVGIIPPVISMLSTAGCFPHPLNNAMEAIAAAFMKSIAFILGKSFVNIYLRLRDREHTPP